MRKLVLSPWDVSFVDDLLALQRQQGFVLMSKAEELDYFEEFKSKDWFMLLDHGGSKPVLKGFIRHFPHFSSESWVQLLIDSKASESEVETLWSRFQPTAYLEEADGFRLVTTDFRFESFFQGKGFKQELSRTWNCYQASQFASYLKNINLWQEPQGFSAAFSFADNVWESSHNISPFQNKAQIWYMEEASIRYEIRDKDLFILHSSVSDDSLLEGISTLIQHLKTTSDISQVWIGRTLSLPRQNAIEERTYLMYP